MTGSDTPDAGLATTPGASGAGQPQAGGENDDAKIGRWYLGGAIGAVVGGVGLGLAIAALTDVHDYKMAAGASAFALIYIVAQAIERVNELLILGLDNTVGDRFAEAKKQQALGKIKSNQGASEPAKLAGARKELRILTMGTAFGLSFVLLASLDMGLMELVTEGNHPPKLLDWLISAAVFAGGTSALHDLISKVQKSKEKDEAAA